MIYITGDTHSDFTRFTEDRFPMQSEMTKNDYVIICGDFGGVWTFEEESSREKEALERNKSQASWSEGFKDLRRWKIINIK